MKWQIKFYQDARGEHPVEKFLRELPRGDQAKTVWALDLLEELGPGLREPHAKHLRGDLWELRAQSIRILYCLSQNVIVLLHAFRKKTARTPANDIRLALKRKQNYLEGREVS